MKYLKPSNNEELKLLPYQREGVSFLADNKYCGLFISMGLGKTVMVLQALEDIKLLGTWGPVLVLAPLYVAETVWPAEVDKWGINLSYQVIRGKPKERLGLLRNKVDITVINYELLPWLVTTRAFRRFRILVMDEVSRMKSTKSLTHRAARSILKQFKRRIGMTGMPVGNHLIDTYGEMYVINQGKTWRTKDNFLKSYFTNVAQGSDFPVWRIKNKQAEKKIHRRVAPWVLSMHQEDYLDLPPFVHKDIWIDLPASVRWGYEEMEREFFIETDSGGVSIDSAADLSCKLSQYLSGFIYSTNDFGERKAVSLNNVKIHAMREILEGLENENILVAYRFAEERKQLQEALHDCKCLTGIKRTQIKPLLDRWNRGAVKHLIGNPRSIGHGLNLQHGGNFILWYSIPWSLDHYDQLNARLRRKGQTKPVTLIRILFRDTIDELISKTLTEKDSTQRRLYENLRRYKEEKTHRGRRARRGR